MTHRHRQSDSAVGVGIINPVKTHEWEVGGKCNLAKNNKVYRGHFIIMDPSTRQAFPAVGLAWPKKVYFGRHGKEE